MPSLKEEKSEKFAMIQLTNTATDPKTVMVKFAYTPSTIPAMPTAIGLLNVTLVAPALLRHV